MRAFVVVFLAIVIPGGLFLALEAGLLDAYLEDIPTETLILQELHATVSPEELDARVLEALEDGRQDDAEMYAEIAVYMDRPLGEDARRIPGQLWFWSDCPYGGQRQPRAFANRHRSTDMYDPPGRH